MPAIIARRGLDRGQLGWLLLAAAAVLGLHATTDLFSGLERRLYDAALSHSSRAPSERIAVIAIDDRSIANIGRWPWPREVHAELIDRLKAAGAKTVAHTALFFEPQTARGLGDLRALREQIESPALPDLGPQARQALVRSITEAEQRLDSDTRLAHSMAAAGNVIVPSVFELGPPLGPPDQPLPAFAQRNAPPDDSGLGVPAAQSQQPLAAIGEAAVAVAHLNLLQDPDGAVRREALLVRFDGHAVPSMALAVAAHSLNLAPADLRLQPGQGLQLGGLRIATDEQATARPQFYPARDDGRPAFPEDAFYDVLSGQIPAGKYAGQIVIIGATAAGVGSAFTTPLSQALAPAQIVAHTTSALLQNHFIVQPAWSALAQLALLAAVLGYLLWLLPRLTASQGAAASGALFVALLGTDYALLSGPALWLPMVLPAALLLVGHLTLVTRRFAITEARKHHSDAESAETNRQMGLALLGQGQLDQAFDRLRRVPHSAAVMDNLQQLALDFERKRQLHKAQSVYEHMAQLDSRNAEVRQRLQRVKQLGETVVLGGGAHPGGTLVLDGSGLEKPMLGRYQVEKELGKGAMGVVYQGRDPRIGRVVAIKTLALSAEFEGHELQDARDRFFREAETAGRLQHPHIVTIFDAGEEHDLAYIAMEFLQGRDLLEHARPGHLLPVATVLSMGVRVAQALDYAHRQNVVHRDIKPANIMYDAVADSVKVTDFGIARITDASRTKTGLVLGTPSFMSPEQLAGQRIDGRSDLYSLGVTLFQLLTGQLPLRGDSMAALMYQIANQSAPDVRTLRPDLPQALADILAKSLKKAPSERYQDGAEMAADLQQAVQRVQEAAADVRYRPPAETGADAFAATLALTQARSGATQDKTQVLGRGPTGDATTTTTLQSAS